MIHIRTCVLFALIAILAAQRVEEPGHESHEDAKHEKLETTVIFGLSYSFSMTALAELGDKTFLMVLIYTTKMNNMVLFLSASASLAMMHTIGCYCGNIFQYFFSEYVLKIVSCVAFFLFGVVLIYQGWTMKEETYEEKIKEVEEELNKSMSYFEIEEG